MKKGLLPMLLAGFFLSLFCACSKSEADAYGMVDLGLSVKWCEHNLGAASPEECGKYYCWGVADTTGVRFDWATYKWWDNSRQVLKKYNTSSEFGEMDGRTVIERIDDVAYGESGGKCRIPTEEEWLELETDCIWKTARRGDMRGYEVISRKNGNSIFIPFAGARYDKGTLYPVGSYGLYWSSSIAIENPCNAWCHCFFAGDMKNFGNVRCYGLSIRPVADYR